MTTSPADVAVRSFAEGDEAAIAGLVRLLGFPTDAATVRRAIEALDPARGSAVLVAEAAGRVVGFVDFHVIPRVHRPGHVGRIMAIAVQFELQGGGIGRALVEAVEGLGREAGCVRLEVTSPPNLGEAHAFYRGLGFVERPKRFYKELEAG